MSTTKKTAPRTVPHDRVRIQLDAVVEGLLDMGAQIDNIEAIAFAIDNDSPADDKRAQRNVRALLKAVRSLRNTKAYATVDARGGLEEYAAAQRAARAKSVAA